MARQCSGCQPSPGGMPMGGGDIGPMGEVMASMFVMSQSRVNVRQADSQAVLDMDGMEIGQFGIVSGTWGTSCRRPKPMDVFQDPKLDRVHEEARQRAAHAQERAAETENTNPNASFQFRQAEKWFGLASQNSDLQEALSQMSRGFNHMAKGEALDR